jgi:ABC-2 type transport system permease protein
MLGALLYLRLTSFKNILLSRVRRLKQPKYLVGAIVGAAYFYFVFFRRFGGTSSARIPRGPLPALPGFDPLPLLATFGSLLLLVIVTFTWALPTEKPGLAFTEAEVAFLFPAPISRRQLIHFKLIGSQFRILLSALFFTLVSSGWRFLGGGALIHAVGWWIILTTVNLHLTGATLTVTRLIEGGVSTKRRRAAVFAVVGAAVAITAVSAWRGGPWPADRGVDGPAAFFTSVAHLLDAGLLHELLIPGKWVVAPFLATNGTMFFQVLWPAALLIIAHYFWVASMEASFEEASVAAAEKRAVRIARIRSGGAITAGKPKARREPFRLRSTRRPELAFLWKNLLSTRPYFHWRVWTTCAAIIAIGVPWLGRQEDLKPFVMLVAVFSGIFGAYTLLLGPQLARQDLRSDLPNSDILKTYPLAGWQILLGQLLTPIAILTGLLWLALIAAFFALQPQAAQLAWLSPGVRIAATLGLAVVVPPLCALQLLIPNAAALIFPAWFHATRQRGGGIDVMGQRLIFVFGQLLVIVLALLPAVGGAGLLIFATQWLVGGTTAIVFATCFVLVVLLGEVWCGLWWLGERFEKLDLATELRP